MSKSQALMSTPLAIAVAALFGRAVLAQEGDKQHKYTIAKLDLDKEPGTMKDKSKELYVVLQPVDGDTATVMSLHPKNAQTLIKGESTTVAGVTYKLEVTTEATSATPANTEVTTEATSATPANTEATSTAEATSATPANTEATSTAEAGVDVAVKKTKPDAPSKKELAIDMYISMANAGKARKDIITAFKEKLGLTQAGANTYYQNCNSFKPGWTVRADEAEAEAGAGETATTEAEQSATEAEQASA